MGDQPGTARWTRRRAAVTAIVALLMPLLLLELGLRGMVAAGWLADAPSRDGEVDTALLQRAADPVADILLMGDSLTRRGIDPAVLAELIGEQTGVEPRVASIAQLDVDLRSMEVLARQLGRLGRLPRVMVIGLSMGNYGGARADAGMRDMERSPMGWLATGCTGRDLVVPWLECVLAQASVAWRWRGEPDRILRALGTRGPGDGMSTGRRIVRGDGFEATHGETQAELDELLATRYRGRVVDITPARLARASRDLRDLVAYLDGQGVRVVLANVPYPPPLLESIQSRFPDLAAQGVVALDTLETAAGTPIHRVGAMGDWWTPEDSSDLKHLSATGAVAFTRQLWDDPSLRAAILAALAP